MDIPLIGLQAGQIARISQLAGGSGFQSNMRSRGIREGKTLKLITKHPLGGPLVISIDGRDTAIGRGMAERIMVVVIQ